MTWISTLYYGVKYYANKKLLNFLDSVENDDNERNIRIYQHVNEAWHQSGWLYQLSRALE